MSQAGLKSPLEADRNRSLFKQANSMGILPLTLSYLFASGMVIFLVYLPRYFGDGARSEVPPSLVCSLLIFVLAAQMYGEMRVNRRLDALVRLLIRKRVFDAEVADSHLALDAGGPAARKPQA